MVSVWQRCLASAKLRLLACICLHASAASSPAYRSLWPKLWCFEALRAALQSASGRSDACLLCSDNKAEMSSLSFRTDDNWHHIAVTWEGHTGLTSLYYDGVEQTPFWRASGGSVDQQYPSKGGVDKHVAAGTARFDHGKQQCTHQVFGAASSTLLRSPCRANLMALFWTLRLQVSSCHEAGTRPLGG